MTQPASIPKFTGELITRGKSFVKTIEIPSQVYGQPPAYKIAVDIKPISRKDMKNLFAKYHITGANPEIKQEDADGLMADVCKLGLVDQSVADNIDDILEYLPTKIGSAILSLSTGSEIDLENFSKPMKDLNSPSSTKQDTSSPTAK